jgi:hypothetical protein
MENCSKFYCEVKKLKSKDHFMQLSYEDIQQDLFIEDEIIINGKVDGNIYVKNKGVLVLDGHCTKIIVVQDGGKARIAGRVDGYVFNLGVELIIDDEAKIKLGTIHIYGMTMGKANYVDDPRPDPET